VPHLEKCAALGKMPHSWKNVPHLEKCAALKKKGAALEKYVPHLEKCATLRKKCRTWKIAPLFKNVPHLEKCAAFRIMCHLEKCAALGKMRHTWKNVLHLERCAALGNCATRAAKRRTRPTKHESRSLVFAASRLSLLKRRKIKKNLWDQG